MHKLGMHSLAELIHYAMDNGISPAGKVDSKFIARARLDEAAGKNARSFPHSEGTSQLRFAYLPVPVRGQPAPCTTECAGPVPGC